MWQWNYVLPMMRHREAFTELYPSGGTTTWPSWNYALALRHHHDPPWNYVLLSRHHQGLPLRGSMELCQIDEAPPRSLITRVMELFPTHTLNIFLPPINNFP